MLHKLNFKYQRKHGVLPVQLNPLDSDMNSMENDSNQNEESDINKGLSVSNMPNEKEEQLFGALNLKGEIAHITYVDNIVPLCKKATDAFATLVLTVLLRTSDKIILTKFVESGGATVLKKWLKQYSAKKDEELTTLVLDVLSTIPMSEMAVKESKIGITMRKLAKVENGFKATEADHIVNKWRQDVVNQRENKIKEKERQKQEAERQAKLKKEEEEKERLRLEEQKRQAEQAKKEKEELKRKRKAEKAEAKAKRLAAAEAAKAERLKKNANGDDDDVVMKDGNNKKRGRDGNDRKKKKKKRRRISWGKGEKLEEVKFFSKSDIVKDPSGNVATNGGKNTGMQAQDDDNNNNNNVNKNNTENQISFKEKQRKDKEKEAAALLKMKQDKKAAEYKNYFDNAIADAEFITPKQILIGQGIEKVRKKLAKKRDTPFSDKIQKENDKIKEYVTKSKAPVDISTEEKDWRDHKMPDCYEINDIEAYKVISGVEGLDDLTNNDDINASNISAKNLDGNNNNEKKGQKVILLEDPRPELLAALSINGGSLVKNDLLPKIVLGKEDSKLVFKGRLSLFQVIPEVKDILDINSNQDDIFKDLQKFVRQEKFPLQKVPLPHLNTIPLELRGGFQQQQQQQQQQQYGQNQGQGGWVNIANNNNNHFNNNMQVQQQQHMQMQRQPVQQQMQQQQPQWHHQQQQQQYVGAAVPMDAAAIAAALMAVQQQPAASTPQYPTKIQPTFTEPGSQMMAGIVTKIVARSPEIAKCFCIVNQDCYLSANTMLMCGQQWPPFMGQGVKLVVYPHQSGKNRWKANWVMYDNTVIQQKGGGVVNGSVRHVSDRWCIVNADIFLPRVTVEGCGYTWPPAIGTLCSVNVIPHVQGKNRWKALNYHQNQ